MKVFNIWLVGLICAALIFCTGALFGSWYETRAAKNLEVKQVRDAFEQGMALGTVKESVVTEYVDRIVTVYKTGATITKEVPIYVSKAADASCVVPNGFVRLHDAGAASVPVSGGPRVTDDAGSGITLSTVAETVVDNYTDCRANAEQLSKLQKWARDSHGVTSGGVNGSQNVPGK
jgi:hypothetical protein